MQFFSIFFAMSPFVIKAFLSKTPFISVSHVIAYQLIKFVFTLDYVPFPFAERYTVGPTVESFGLILLVWFLLMVIFDEPCTQ